ncbi:MAG: hypothetical protein QGH12_05450, partial [SAR324 cluster bacterium]|nr:hypothetical protein [SAR324 cluster bacterium]
MCFEARTEAVNRMELFGNWEANTMTGKGHQGAIVSLDGQKFNIRPVASNTAEAITKSIVTLMEALNDFVYTVTYDNTKGGTRHETLAKKFKSHTV